MCVTSWPFYLGQCSWCRGYQSVPYNLAIVERVWKDQWLEFLLFLHSVVNFRLHSDQIVEVLNINTFAPRAYKFF